LVPADRKKAHILEADELSNLPISKYVSFGVSEAPFRGVEHAWKPQELTREMHLFPGLENRVLSKCSDAHTYFDHGTFSPFQRWQSAFVSSGI